MSLIKTTNKFGRFKWRGLKGLRQDTAGVSAIEFALIAPILVLLYFGGVELSFLMQADRRVTTVTATIGDLTSRETVIGNSRKDDIFAASGLLIAPLNSSVARMRISNLVADASGTVVTVDWSDATTNFTPRAVGSTINDIPAGVIAADGSVVMAEVEYPYDPVIDFLNLGDQVLTDTFYLRPRRTNRIIRDTTTGS